MNYRNFDPKKYALELTSIFEEIFAVGKLNESKLRKILHRYPKDGDKIFSKDQLVQGFHYLRSSEDASKNSTLNFADKELPSPLKKKPTRTISGVTTVTVLTKPFPCLGKCIFCPNDITMPKSYIASEPGAQRAIANRFNPYNQVINRLKALHQTGHPTQKIELLILGGTWSYYPKSYQKWFVKECFRAMNDFAPQKFDTTNSSYPSKNPGIDPQEFNKKLRRASKKTTYNELVTSKEYKNSFAKEFESTKEDASYKELFAEHKKNETAHARCVGLVLETRPDRIDKKEVIHMRKLGATKVQIGVQTLDERVNKANKRLETIDQIANAFDLLRQAGFKIHAHLMPNLYKSTPQKDLDTFRQIFEDPSFKPDELKIYPTSTIKYTELHKLYKEGKYTPYATEQLVNLLADMLEQSPRYCRLNRIIRDIPSDEISAGNKKTNLRQMVEEKLKKENRKDENIRAREIRSKKFDTSETELKQMYYSTKTSKEYFLEYVTTDDHLLGFLRLSLPRDKKNSVTRELNNSAIIREIHVYGPAQNIAKASKSKHAQHIGLGSKLIKKAKEISRNNNYEKLSVISAIGTRPYYRKKGFKDEELYQHTST